MIAIEWPFRWTKTNYKSCFVFRDTFCLSFIKLSSSFNVKFFVFFLFGDNFFDRFLLTEWHHEGFVPYLFLVSNLQHVYIPPFEYYNIVIGYGEIRLFNCNSNYYYCSTFTIYFQLDSINENYCQVDEDEIKPIEVKLRDHFGRQFLDFSIRHKKKFYFNLNWFKWFDWQIPFNVQWSNDR